MKKLLLLLAFNFFIAGCSTIAAGGSIGSLPIATLPPSLAVGAEITGLSLLNDRRS
jgi:hypothetical protein